MRIWYEGQSTDPVFPADLPQNFQGRDWYRKSDPKATALGCIDQTFLCDRNGENCKSNFETFDEIQEQDADFWMLRTALNQSDTLNSMILRQGNALVAQERLSIFNSPRLGSQHWKEEAERIFHSTLAWVQFATWGLADGEGKQFVADEGYSDFTPKHLNGDLCKLFKFRATGVINVRLWPLIIWSLVWPMTWALSLDVSTARKSVSWMIGVARAIGRKFRRQPRPPPPPAPDQGLAQAAVQAGDNNAGPAAGNNVGNAQAANNNANQHVNEDAANAENNEKWEPLVLHWIIMVILWYILWTLFWLVVWFLWDIIVIGIYQRYGQCGGHFEPTVNSRRYDNLKDCWGEVVQWLHGCYPWEDEHGGVIGEPEAEA